MARHPSGTHSVRSVNAVRYIPLQEIPVMNRSAAKTSQVGANTEADKLMQVVTASEGEGNQWGRERENGGSMSRDVL